MFQEERDILSSFPKRGHVNGNHGKPVIEVFAERAPGNRFFKIQVGRCDDPHIELVGPGSADRLHHLFLQGAQELRLEVHRQLSHFIEKEGSSVGLEEFARLVLDSAGKRSLDMAEQLAFQEIAGDGGAVYGYERGRLP